MDSQGSNQADQRDTSPTEQKLTQGINGEARSLWIYKQRGLIMAVVAIVVLLLGKPCPASVIIGWLLCALGEGLRLWALGYSGEPTRSQQLEAEKLIISGPYSVVRNPLYLGNVLNSLAVLIACCGGLAWWGAALLMPMALLPLYIVYSACIIAEETYLSRRFGQAYRAYHAAVPSIIPDSLSDFFKAKDHGEEQFCACRLRFEKVTLILIVVIWVYLGVSAWL